MFEKIPADLSPCRTMIGFSAGGYVALVSIAASISPSKGSLRNWIAFNEPAIRGFGFRRTGSRPPARRT